MSKSLNINKIKRIKSDEFYTQIEDIEKELNNYIDSFKNKIIYCNCNDSESSNFYKYFEKNFEFLKIKKLITTNYGYEKPAHKLEIFSDINYKKNKPFPIKTLLNGNGDFKSKECIDLMKEADIIITNPPASLFKEYIAQVIKLNKSFIVIGSQNAISYNEIFSLFKDNILWSGCTQPRNFLQSDGNIRILGNIQWYTNILNYKRSELLPLYKKYNDKYYPKLDNIDAINIDKLKDLPMDYDGIMGVPITFISNYNPNQFKIIGIMPTIKIDGNYHDYSYINGKKLYVRIFIKKI